MGENRNRIVWLENDVSDIKKRIDTLMLDIAAGGIDANSFEEELTSQGAAINEMAETIAKFTREIAALNTNNRILASNDAKVWLSEMDTTCRQVKDSVQAIHAWQNQMSKEFSAALERLGGNDSRFANVDKALGALYSKLDKAGEASRLKLAVLADDRIRDLERALDEATEHSRGVVARMEQLETRLRRLEDAPRGNFGKPIMPVTIQAPQGVCVGVPLAKRPSDSNPSQIQCRERDFEAGNW